PQPGQPGISMPEKRTERIPRLRVAEPETDPRSGSASPPTDRVVAILNALAQPGAQPMTVRELTRALDLNEATCHAIVGRLAASGFLARMGASKRYSLGPRALAIGLAAQKSLMPLPGASARLAALSEATGQQCSLRAKHGDRITVLEYFGEGPSKAHAGS